MPLFGPNIKKMKENRDVEGLMKLLDDADPTKYWEAFRALRDLRHVEGLIKAFKSTNWYLRVESAEALKEINIPEATKQLSEILIKTLKYGKFEDKIEAITLIYGRGNWNFLVPVLSSASSDGKRGDALTKVQRKLLLEPILSALDEMLEKEDNQVVGWYALITLVELGERNDENLRALIKSSDDLITNLGQPEGLGGILFAEAICEETLRALSYFRDNPVATTAVIGALEGRFLAFKSGEESRMRYALYTLGALGDPTTHERLEYLAGYGAPEFQRIARIALELFGRATYDEISKR